MAEAPCSPLSRVSRPWGRRWGSGPPQLLRLRSAAQGCPRHGPARPGPPPAASERSAAPPAGPGPPLPGPGPPRRPSKAGADMGGSEGEAELCPVQADPQERGIKCSLPSGCNRLYSIGCTQPSSIRAGFAAMPAQLPCLLSSPQTLPRAAWLLPLPQAGEPGAAQPSPGSTPSAHCSPQGAGGGVPWGSWYTTATPSFAPKQSQFEQLKHSYRGFCSPRHGFVAGPLGAPSGCPLPPFSPAALGLKAHPSVHQGSRPPAFTQSETLPQRK